MKQDFSFPFPAWHTCDFTLQLPMASLLHQRVVFVVSQQLGAIRQIQLAILNQAPQRHERVVPQPLNAVQDDDVSGQAGADQGRVLPDRVATARGCALLQQVSGAHVLVQIQSVHVVLQQVAELFDELRFATSCFFEAKVSLGQKFHPVKMKHCDV
jgi:hypothetical protein